MANFYIDTTEVVHEIPQNDRPKFYMFGVPRYTNMGDQAVSLAERKYIENEFPNYQYIEIIEEDGDEAIPVVQRICVKMMLLRLLVVAIWVICITTTKRQGVKYFRHLLTTLRSHFPNQFILRIMRMVRLKKEKVRKPIARTQILFL